MNRSVDWWEGLGKGGLLVDQTCPKFRKEKVEQKKLDSADHDSIKINESYLKLYPPQSELIVVSV